jgi:hypothetical protein
MKRAFIVKLELDNLSDLGLVAEDIQLALADDGYEVISVAPYAAPEQMVGRLDEIRKAQALSDISPLGDDLI